MTNPEYQAKVLFNDNVVASTAWDSYYGTKDWVDTKLIDLFKFKKAGADGYSRIGLARARSNGLGEFLTVTVPDWELVIYYREKPTETNNRT